MNKVVEETGLVPVKMLKSYDNNSRGEIAGFLPEVAKALVDQKIATFDLKHKAGPVQKAVEAPAADVEDAKDAVAEIEAANTALEDENAKLRAEIEALKTKK